MKCSDRTLIHKHHIIPRYKGGTDDPENLVEVTVTQHAMYHYCNYQLWGNVEDYVAWRGLSGQISKEEFLLEKFILFGKIGYQRLHEKIKNDPQLAKKIRQKQLDSWNKNKERHLVKIRLAQPKAVEAARTPEAREKKRKKLKEIKHQQGEKNSQYGTMWIHNDELKKSKRINKNDKIPKGWKKGRVVNFERNETLEKKRENKRNETRNKKELLTSEKIQFYTNWYSIYQTVNFKTFCEITNYRKTQQNLCSKFKKFVKEYNPKAKNGTTKL